MISAFNQVYKAFQGFLSQDFWYTIFLPIVLFASIHALIATCFGWPVSLGDLLSGAGKHAQMLLVLLASLVISGYVLQSFLPMLRGILDGTLLPAWLHDQLRRERLRDLTRVRRRTEDARQLIGQVRTRCKQARAPDGPLKTAWAAGLQRGDAPRGDLIQEASRAADVVRERTDGGRPIDLALLDGALHAIVAALAANNPEVAVGQPTAGVSSTLQQAANRFDDVLTAATLQADYEYQIDKDRYRVVGAFEVPRATLLGDARYVVEAYSFNVYAVNFDFLWPRLMVLLRSDATPDPCLTAVDAARSRVDFAMVCLLLACTVPLAWGPAVLALGGPVWLIPLIGGATPLVVGLLYQMAVEGQLALGESVKTTIDRNRLRVLRMMQQPTPLSRAEERELWSRIHGAEEDGRTTSLVYVPAGPA